MFVETYGVPLEVLVSYLDNKDCIVDWLDFIQDSIKKNWPLHRTILRLQMIVGDVYGREYREGWEDRLREIGYNVPGGDP